MSGFDLISLGDPADRIYLDLNAPSQRDEEALEHDRQLRLDAWEKVGDVQLLNGESIPFYHFADDLPVAAWRHCQYLANRRLGGLASRSSIEPILVRELMVTGRSYAITRYAHREHVSLESAKVAISHYGIIALILRYLVESNLPVDFAQVQRAKDVVSRACDRSDVTAYRKTALIQRTVHAAARQAWGTGGELLLDREATRKLLSLSRLFFAIHESTCHSLHDVGQLLSLYEREWNSLRLEGFALAGYRRTIKNWAARHHKPIVYYYPQNLRSVLLRWASIKNTEGANDWRSLALNELALVYACSMRGHHGSFILPPIGGHSHAIGKSTGFRMRGTRARRKS